MPKSWNAPPLKSCSREAGSQSKADIMSNQYPHGPIQDPRINAVIERMQAARRPGGGGPRGNRSASRDPHD